MLAAILKGHFSFRNVIDRLICSNDRMRETTSSHRFVSDAYLQKQEMFFEDLPKIRI